MNVVFSNVEDKGMDEQCTVHTIAISLSGRLVRNYINSNKMLLDIKVIIRFTIHCIDAHDRHYKRVTMDQCLVHLHIWAKGYPRFNQTSML